MLCYDTIFKSVFRNQENILGKMISDITGMDYSLLKDNLVLKTNELPIYRKDEKFKRCDFVITVDEHMILNLELNRQSHTGLIVKNLSYVFQLFSTAFKKGEDYDEDLIVMQINLDCFKDSSNKKALSKYYLQEENSHHIYSNNLIIYTLNIVNCHELYYNEDIKKIPNYVRWGELLYCHDLSKIPSITKGIMTYEERNTIMGILDKLTKEDLFMSESDALKWEEWEKNTIYKDGIKEGNQQTTIEIVQSMLKNHFDLDTISKVTNKSIEEIKEIEKM